MTKFNVGDKVVALSESLHKNIEKGDVGVIRSLAFICNDGLSRLNVANKNVEKSGGLFLPEQLELVPPRLSNKKRITKLESEIAELLPLKEEVAELKLIVHQLRKPNVVKHVPVLDGSPLPSTVVEEVSTSSVEDVIEYEGQQYQKVDREAREGDIIVFTKSAGRFVTAGKPYKVISKFFIDNDGDEINVYDGIAGGSPETVDVYELIKPSTNYDRPPTIDELMEEGRKVQDVQHQTIPCSAANTNNQLRAEIIEKTKGFVEDGAKVDLSLNRGRGYIVQFEDACKGGYICDLDFVVNTDKRTVVAILRWNTPGQSEIKAKGIAKCHPNNVFNESIGRAIALGRALGIDVSEFEGAVQPNEYAIGQTLFVEDDDRVIEVKHIQGNEIWHALDDERDYDNYYYSNRDELYGYPKLTIINDTNAIYGGVE